MNITPPVDINLLQNLFNFHVIVNKKRASIFIKLRLFFYTYLQFISTLQSTLISPKQGLGYYHH